MSTKIQPIDIAKLNESIADGDAVITLVSANGSRVRVRFPDGSTCGLYWSNGDWHFNESGGSVGYDHACGYRD